MFLKPHSMVIEIFPYKYFKRSYIQLSSKFSIQHHWIQLNYSQPAEDVDLLNQMGQKMLYFVDQKDCMADLKCRSYARSRNLKLQEVDVKSISTYLNRF